jgi:hypothetical protein
MKYLQWAAWAVNVPCQVLLLNALLRTGLRTHLRGGLRTYPFLFAYVLVLLLSTVAYMAASEDGRLPSSWAWVYWTVDLVLEALLYALVLSLIWRALRANPNRARLMRLMVAGVVLVWLAALALSHAGRLNEWMTNFTKYVAFAGAVMNLGLWATLVERRHPDRSVLLISGGYGVLSAGEAISQSLRALAVRNRSFPLLAGGNLIGAIAQALCLLIWWRAIVSEQSPTRAPGEL